jgi:hypothetical protein
MSINDQLVQHIRENSPSDYQLELFVNLEGHEHGAAKYYTGPSNLVKIYPAVSWIPWFHESEKLMFRHV